MIPQEYKHTFISNTNSNTCPLLQFISPNINFQEIIKKIKKITVLTWRLCIQSTIMIKTTNYSYTTFGMEGINYLHHNYQWVMYVHCSMVRLETFSKQNISCFLRDHLTSNSKPHTNKKMEASKSSINCMTYYREFFCHSEVV